MSGPSRLIDGRNSRGNAIIRYITYDHGICTNGNVVPNDNGPKYLRARADIYVVANPGCAGLIDTLKSDDNTISYAAIIAKTGVAADDDSTEMVNDEIGANLRFAWELYPGDDLHEFERQFVEQGKKLPQ